MPINLAAVKAIDPDSPQYQRLFNNLQGNIVKGHSRNYAVCLFLRFGSERKKTRAWLKEFCALNLTSTTTQIHEARRYRKYRVEGSLFVNLYLTAHGYRALGFRENQMPADTKFRRGMAASQEALADPTQEEWHSNFQHPFDAMVLLAHGNRQELIGSARAIREEMHVILKDSFVEMGNVIRTTEGQVIEHFGYADGLSQPLFLKDDIDKAMRRGGIDRWNPLAPLSSILVPDPLGGKHFAYGSYLVFRKLEQNVAAFHKRLAELAKAIDNDNPDVARAGAYVVGRFQDGRPLALEKATESTDANMPVQRAVTNNFRYEDDVEGTRCPMHAHIRKLNPRAGDGFGAANSSVCQVVRRGIPYGRSTATVNTRWSNSQWTNSILPSSGVGLLFMCFQSDIGKQFEFMQSRMANEQHPTGRDPIVGQGDDQSDVAGQLWPSSEDGEKVHFDFGKHVKMCGGEYFFAPSLSFFDTLV